VLLAVQALADFYVANINHFAGDGPYLAERRLTIHGASKRQQYIGFLRSTVDTVFKTRKWNLTALLNKLAESGVLCVTEKDRYTKKVAIEGVTHRLICVRWHALFLADITHPE
jgi:hypothetical protein